MTVINISKDGTVIEDLSKVTVPKEISQAVLEIAKEEVKK